jgi:sigma-B regulation protein RsbU (phosphoserine phosphatase)
MYSDGLTEARDPGGEMYGSPRLREVLRQAPADAGEAGLAILADVRRFAAGRPPADDLTLVCFSRTPDRPPSHGG